MDPTQYRITELVIQLGNTVTWFGNQNMQAMGLTSSQSTAIRYILKHYSEHITAGDLMERLGLSQSTVAGIIKRLEGKSLIERYPDPEDARKILIVPTREGLALEGFVQEISAQAEHILLQNMTQAEQDQFFRSLQAALDHMNAIRASGGKVPSESEGMTLYDDADTPVCPQK